MARDTLSVALDEPQRYNHMPVAPTCALLGYLRGECQVLVEIICFKYGE